jgi:hypothetical protein
MYDTPPSQQPNSPRDGPSPLTVAILEKSAEENSQMLIQGNFQELMASLSPQDKRYVLCLSTLSLFYQIDGI